VCTPVPLFSRFDSLRAIKNYGIKYSILKGLFALKFNHLVLLEQPHTVGAVPCMLCRMCRVGQIHIYTVYTRYFWQGNHQICGHIRRIYTVIVNPVHEATGRVIIKHTCTVHHFTCMFCHMWSLENRVTLPSPPATSSWPEEDMIWTYMVRRRSCVCVRVLPCVLKRP